MFPPVAFFTLPLFVASTCGVGGVVESPSSVRVVAGIISSPPWDRDVVAVDAVDDGGVVLVTLKHLQHS